MEKMVDAIVIENGVMLELSWLFKIILFHISLSVILFPIPCITHIAHIHFTSEYSITQVLSVSEVQIDNK